MGLATATPSAATGPRLYAADFANNRIDIVNAQWAARQRAGRVRGPEPARRVRRLTASRRSATGSSSRTPLKGPLPASVSPARRRPRRRQRLRSQRHLPSARGEPGRRPERAVGDRVRRYPNFGQFGGDLLIGNFGDGRINAFHENADGTWTNKRLLMRGINGQPLSIGGLWALQFGKGVAAATARSRSPVLHGRVRTARPRACSGEITPNPNEGITDVTGSVPATLSLTLGRRPRSAPSCRGSRTSTNRVDHRQRHHHRW